MPSSLYLVICSRVLIGVLLTMAGAMKMAHRASFRAVVRGFALVPDKFTSTLASVMPVLECVTGILILLAVALNDRALRWACAGAFILFLVFGVAVAINLVRGRRSISCGCFNATDEDGISWPLVARNAALCVIAFLAFPSVGGASLAEHANSRERLDATLVAIFVLLACKLSFAMRRLWGYGREFNPHRGLE